MDEESIEIPRAVRRRPSVRRKQFGLDNPHISTSYNSPFRQISSTETARNKPCKCSSSRCLQKYCECFRYNQFCRNCNCKNCHNNPEHARERQIAVQKALMRDPNAFQYPIPSAQSLSQKRSRRRSEEFQGCSCRTSQCLKHCECAEDGAHCSDSCQCIDCANNPNDIPENDVSARIPAMKDRIDGNQIASETDLDDWSKSDEPDSVNTKYAAILNSSKSVLNAVLNEKTISRFCQSVANSVRDANGVFDFPTSDRSSPVTNDNMEEDDGDDLLCLESESVSMEGNEMPVGYREHEARILQETDKFLKQVLSDSQRINRERLMSKGDL